MAPLLKTQALVMHEVGKPFVLQDVYIDEALLDSEQALVDFKVAGICHTDISTQEGLFPHALPAVLGHEGAGTVRKLPANYQGPLSIGDEVLCSFDACGKHCTSCKIGYPSACHSFFPRIFAGLRQDGTTTDCFSDKEQQIKINLGFFGQSSFMRTGIVNLGSMIKIEKGLPLHLLCAYGCGLMTGLGTVINKLLPSTERTFAHLPDYDSLHLPDLPPNIIDSTPKSIVIFGLGAVGMGAIIGAKVAKIHHIIAVDLVESRLQLALEAGATHTINGKMSTEEFVEAVKKICPDGANMSLEASGSGIALENAIACLAPMGKCAGVGAPKPGLTISIDMNSMVATNRTYMGVLFGDANTSILLPYMVALYKRGDFDIVEKLVTTYKPEEVDRAIEDSKSGKVVKPVIVW